MDNDIPKAKVSKGKYRGRPLVVIKFQGDADDTRPFQFGSGKARRLLSALDGGVEPFKKMLRTVITEAEKLDAQGS